MDDKPKQIKCTMRLLKKGTSPDDAMAEEHGLESYRWEGIPDARVFAGTIYTSAPTWIPFVKESVSQLPKLTNRGSAAIIFVPADDRVIAVCFGHAQFGLDLDKFERGFGLRVTLNCVARTSLRNIDTAAPDAVTVQRRIQASRDSDLSVFGIDFDQDIVTLAAGTPGNKDFARFLAGKDSLSITCPMEPSELQAKCNDVLKTYKSTDYRAQFGWIDHVRAIKEKDLVERLDGLLSKEIQKMRRGDDSDLHLTPPEIVDYTEGAEVHYNGFGSEGRTFACLNIEDYINELNRVDFQGEIEEIRAQHRIAVRKEGENRFAEKWKLFDSFVFDATYNKKKYVLFSGDWFEIDKKFADEVVAFFDALPRVAIIGSSDQPNETKLIEHLNVSRSGDLLMLDQVKINPEGVRYANLEPCDFLSAAKQFIHIKDGHSSGPISHLWNQGVVAAEAFLMDVEFRRKLRAAVKKKNASFATLLPDGREKVVPTDYSIVYAIMREKRASGDVDLPFFSKVSLRTAARRLEMMGFPVYLELILKTGPFSSHARAAAAKKAAKIKAKSNAKVKKSPKPVAKLEAKAKSRV